MTTTFLNSLYLARSGSIDSDEIYPSTAPTTPDGSLTFSPPLNAVQLRDAFANDTMPGLIGLGELPGLSRSFESDLNLQERASGLPRVRNICCVGAGYVGGPTSAVIAFQNPGIIVNVVDRDAARIASWNSKHLPVHENGLGEIVRIARDGSNSTTFSGYPQGFDDSSFSGNSEDGEQSLRETTVRAREANLFFSTDVDRCVSEADIILVTVNTPTKMQGMGAGRATDMTALEGATRQIAAHARPGAILVEKSTVPCGTSELISEILQEVRPGVPFEILSNPEFLAEGTAVKDLMQPDRVIIGSSNTVSGRRAAAVLSSVYAAWVSQSRISTINVWSSELCKLTANAMLAQRISSINSISAICEETGANVEEIAKAIGLDPRIGPQFLKSGLGFGGSCFKKDILSLTYLAESLGLHKVAEYWQQVLSMNDFQRERFSKRIIRKLNNTLVRKKITLLGYAFKKNTSDTREAPALDVVRSLLNDRAGEIAIFDPCCDPELIKQEIQSLLGSKEVRLLKEEGGPVEVYTDVYGACKASNAVVILTEWDEFRNSPHVQRGKHGKKTKVTRTVLADPRPFAGSGPSETEMLALHRFLVSRGSLQRLKNDSQATLLQGECDINGVQLDDSNPLGRYKPEPACAEGCKECARTDQTFTKVGQPLDWLRIAESIKSPKWVFDGRGILDATGLEALGCRVEAIGRAFGRA